MKIVTLPTVRVTAGDLVKPRAVKQGELAHVRFEFAPRDVTYALVPAQVAKQWVEVGVQEQPRSVTVGLVRPDPSALGPMAAVRVRFGKRDTKNFLVSPALARKWADTAKRFERLHEDYQRMMKGGQ